MAKATLPSLFMKEAILFVLIVMLRSPKSQFFLPPLSTIEKFSMIMGGLHCMFRIMVEKLLNIKQCLFEISFKSKLKIIRDKSIL
jgi:hypothetical protein